ncbi:glycoside hydrolase family 5 protein [Sphingomonas abietis]|uniref:Cellulase family glycosylhydrolase n=1 Tax=Sphingomonas abietis TaxID=3012344 RepID=A0ABY7NHQ5_9SPHN|nr:cellulase family glycosylhydrolase [Sphingomonas abietis]WBO20853.1 cellulase family glycosylhydrolase [Sphingomonas abietis]
MKMLTRRAAVALGAGLPLCAGPVFGKAAIRDRSPFLMGVNLAGSEFEAIGGQWNWPDESNLRYYLSKGFDVFRVPFRWTRLQPTLNAPLDPAAMAGLDRLVEVVTQAGATILLDAHDYGRRGTGVIGAANNDATIAAFADFWGRLALRYGKQPRIWYGLMNEPHDQDAHLNLAAQNAACAAIRHHGGRGKVLFSGIAWTGAHSWIDSGNGSVMLGAVDPADNFGFDMHQYLDEGFGGSRPDAIPGIGAKVLLPVIAWARSHSRTIFIGEFSTGPSLASLRELTDMVDVMTSHHDVFIGATYWAGGGVWGKDNSQTIDPIGSVDKPQMAVLRHFIGKY